MESSQGDSRLPVVETKHSTHFNVRTIHHVLYFLYLKVQHKSKHLILIH